MEPLSEAHARELLHLAAASIARRRGELEGGAFHAGDANRGAEGYLEHYDAWAAELVASLAGALQLPSDERQAALVGLKRPPPEDVSTLSLLKADGKTRNSAADVLLVAMLQGECYEAHDRAAFREIAAPLGFSGPDVPKRERRIALLLAEAPEALEAPESPATASSAWSFSKAGLALAGGVAVAMGGVMAAPMVAGGLGSLLAGVGLGGTSVASAAAGIAGHTGIVGALFGGFGAMKTNQMVEKATEEVDDFDFLPLVTLPESQDGAPDPSANPTNPLHTTIGVSGFLRTEDDITEPWHVLPTLSTPHALRFQPDALLPLGSLVADMISSRAIGYIRREIIRRTVLATLYSSLWPLGLLRYAAVLDNPFSHALSIAKKAGVRLAATLLARRQGPGPVTLIGTSLGATAVFHCLLELEAAGAYHLVDSAFLCGAPVPTSHEQWARARRAAAGRLVNAYSPSDYLLAFLFRVAGLSLGCAGVQAVGVAGVEDFDVGDTVGASHWAYNDRLGAVLRQLGVDVVPEAVDAQELAWAPPPEPDADGDDDAVEVFDAPMGAESAVFAAVQASEGAGTGKREREEESGSDGEGRKRREEE
ncbi:hypothetical protein DFJ74DRAFT_647917 [Hyaloraphidium curvatum]|nr:hypothetical protein DFJ74DRAFT_647917 [Hyaloraphidium curvatum]